MRTLNLGIVAHVDAGKTSLTERLLYAAGVITQPGSVDAGTTQTDSLLLERQRGITIKSAAVSFAVDDVTVNLIDTPGHPDFIAEVERALRVLDGAVLLLSAVEGVQPQTRILLRALRRLAIPALIFINKIDRAGARSAAVLRDIAAHLTPAVISLGTVRDEGSDRAAFVPHAPAAPAFVAELSALLAEHDPAVLAAYLDGVPPSAAALWQMLAAHSRRALVHPVFCGSAITGAGVPELMAGLTGLLPAAAGDAAAPLSGTVFKVERGAAGEKIASARLFTGRVHPRDRLRYGAGHEGRVTALRLFERGEVVARPVAAAGQIAKLWGLSDIQTGDSIGTPRPGQGVRSFAPPVLETVVLPSRPAERRALHLALTQLAEQDPLINLRHDEQRGETSISLYGEVQKEVIQATLAQDYGLAVDFRPSTPLCIERPAGTGAAVEVMRVPPNPFLATVGLRIEPAPPGSGIVFRTAVAVHGTMPPAFVAAVEDSISDTLRQGLYGWQVTDCAVTLTHTGYAPRQSHAHQGFSKSMSSTGADFRGLTPLVLMAALAQAGVLVEEPVHRFHLEIPADSLSAVLPLLARLRAAPLTQEARAAAYVLAGEMPAAAVHDLHVQLAGLTRGEGALETAFARYQPAAGPPPARPRTGPNPLDRKQYLLRVLRRVEQPAGREVAP